MLGKYIKVNGIQYPNPTSYNETPVNIETVNTSEAGTELISVNQLMKLSNTMTFQVSSHWLKKIEEHCGFGRVELELNGVVYLGRLRMTGKTLAPYSETSENSDGYWTVTVQFFER